MEELEGVVLLNQAHSEEILRGCNSSSSSKGATQHVLITAGEAGILKLFKVEMKGKDINTFVITSLLHFPLSTAHRSLLSHNISIGKNNTSSMNAAALQGISSLHYMPKSNELLSVTKDFNLCSYKM